MRQRAIEATVLAPLRDGSVVHSYLLDLGEGRKGRLPVEELQPAKGDKPRAFLRGTPVKVHVIHHNKSNGRMVVSERAAYFLNVLDRLDKKDSGWRELFPEEHSWHYRKGRWECIAVWPLWRISFRRR